MLVFGAMFGKTGREQCQYTVWLVQELSTNKFKGMN
jgi:hypothetical protein